MARMRNVLDRGGNWVSPAAAALQRAPAMDGGSSEPPQEGPVVRRIVAYRSDLETWGKSMTGWEALRLFDLAQGGFRLRATPEQFATLSADLRQHFMPVWEEVATSDE